MSVAFRIRLRDLQTRQEAWHEYSTEEQYADHQDFWWLEGNGACDCNRLSFLHQALGCYVEPPEDVNNTPDDPYPCGHDRVALIEAWRDGVKQDWADDRPVNPPSAQEPSRDHPE